MKSVFKKLFKNKYYLFMIITVLLTVVIMGTLCFSYYVKVKSTIKEESESYILEISGQLKNNVSRNINDNFSALQTIAVALNDKTIDSFETLANQVASLQEHWLYNEILVIDKNARSYDENGNEVRLTNDIYLQNALVGRIPSMSASEQINGKECVVFVIPVSFDVEGNNILALAATYGLETFDKILSMSAFEGKGYAHIIHKNGTMIVRSSSENSFEAGYNLLNTLENGEFSGKDFASVRREIRSAESGFAEVKFNGISLYMSYLPLGTNSYYEDWRLVTFIPLSEVNDKSNLLLILTLLLSGLITFLFAALLAAISFVTVKSRKKLEKIAYIDSVTGGNTMQKFKELAVKTLQNNKGGTHALLFTNIGKFKVLNEQYGRYKCDKLLTAINKGICDDLDSEEYIGRLSADNFVILVKMENEKLFTERVESWKKSWEEHFKNSNLPLLPFTVEIGVYIIKNDSKQLNQMIDRAKLALKDTGTVTNENLRISFYNHAMGEALKREKQLEDIMEQALVNGEFKVYLQPKYITETETIGGAEALSRWDSATLGMIYPNEFIPLFEKNGFIQKLDLYVFNAICKLQRDWIDSGIAPIKISVNCSRVHLKDENFIEKYVEIVKKYNVPFGNLEIEFTENIVFEDLEYFSKIINKIREYGFGCSMDDFGSGYSSLSMIQDIPVDTIKLDKVFFKKRSSYMSDRTESVVASIINLSKALSMIVVAEGVEDVEQVNILKRLKCNMIQGYYFAKPMPITDFEKLMSGEKNEKEKTKK